MNLENKETKNWCYSVKHIFRKVDDNFSDQIFWESNKGLWVLKE